jgi:hypothetical protein
VFGAGAYDPGSLRGQQTHRNWHAQYSKVLEVAES